MAELEKDCLFCKIIRGEIPSYTVFENDDVKAFLDISQVTPGHTLVVPKEHHRNLLEMDATSASQLFAKIPVIAQKVKKTLLAFYNIFQLLHKQLKSLIRLLKD